MSVKIVRAKDYNWWFAVVIATGEVVTEGSGWFPTVLKAKALGFVPAVVS